MISLTERLRPARKRLSPYWCTFLLCMLTALLIFLPFQIIDGGFFHYAGDFNSQQISFWRYLNQFVKDGGTFVWPADLGSGAVNAFSFYTLGSPFFWVSLLFPADWMPYLMCPLLALKFGVAGGGAYLYLRRYAKKDSTAIIGACLYAFSGFAVYSTFFNHFVDVVALFPYMLWALDESMYKKRHGLFALTAALNLLTNYFFFAGQIVFLVIYFVCKLVSGEYKLTAKKFFTLAFESILAAGIGCLLAWPAVLSLAQNPRTVDLSSGWGFLTYSKPQQYLAILTSWILPPDSPYITSIFTEGVLKWTNMTAYLPLCSLAGVFCYWGARHGTSTKKILGTCAICALVPVLNSAFYCLNSSYYARWYYMPVLMMALATMQVLEDESISLEPGVLRTGLLMAATLAFAVCPVYDKATETWSMGVASHPGQYFAVLALGLSGLIIFYVLATGRRTSKGFARRMVAGILAFSCVYAVVHIGIGKFGQWDTDSDLVSQYHSAEKLADILPEGSYRVDDYESHDNLGMWMNKSDLEYFGSTVAPSILSFYPDVGVTRDVRSQPDISQYALRGLLSVKYMLVPADKDTAFEEKADAGWTLTDYAAGDFIVYQNDNYVPFGFTYDSYLTDEQYTDTAESLHGNILMHSILLTNEQIVKYGASMRAANQAELENLGYEDYAKDAAARRANACSEFTMTNTGFDAAITLEKGSLVFFSVPYDDGFTATVNGEDAVIEQVDHGMMAVWCEAGENAIHFEFHTNGFSLSSKICAGSSIVYLIYLGYFVWQRRKKPGAVEATETLPDQKEDTPKKKGTDTKQGAEEISEKAENAVPNEAGKSMPDAEENNQAESAPEKPNENGEKTE